MDVDKGYSNFNELVETFGNHNLIDAYEAETRKKVIDGILEKVLGWDFVNDINYEVRVSEDGNTEFADYVISTLSISIIVEAKKAGRTFELPVNRTTAILGGVVSEGEIGKAIRQVRDYSRKESIPFAVVTNGISWVIFPAIRTDRVPFESTQAIVFRDFKDIKERFVEFWELLSKQRVIEGNLEAVLFGEEKNETKRRLLSQIREPGFRLGRNNVYKHIESAVSVALTDEALLQDPDALSICYVKTTERVKYDSRLKMHIADQKPSLERKVVRTKKKSNQKHLDKTIEESITSLPQFILLLGPVGAGKTTFLHYTRKVSAKNTIEGKIVWLYIDFKRATEKDDPRDFIYQELLSLIENDDEFDLGNWDNTIQHAYNDYIKNLRIGALNMLYKKDRDEFNAEISKKIAKERDEKEPYVEKILRYVSKKYSIFIVIDNVDQLENDDYQSKVFIEAQAAARKMSSNIIMSLRDATYLKHRNSPNFDAFQVDTIYIDPPSVKPVLSRRFAYAQKRIDGKSAIITSEKGLKFSVDDLGVFFKIVSSSLLEENTGYMIEVMSGGNIRRALLLTREFLASAHISADKALKTYISEGKYRFPEHEVFKGMFFGQKKFYREEESIILNIFDSKLNNQNLQLLRLQVLNYLVKKASDATFEGIEFLELQSDLYRLGIQKSDSLKVLNGLMDNSAIRTADGLPFSEDSLILPTRFGGYWTQEMRTRFDYLEPCLLDANIYDENYWKKLSDLTSQIESTSEILPKIELRVERIKIFLEYLIILEQHWIVQCKRINISTDWTEKVISNSKSAILEELERVMNSAQRHYSE